MTDELAAIVEAMAEAIKQATETRHFDYEAGARAALAVALGPLGEVAEDVADGYGDVEIRDAIQARFEAMKKALLAP